MREQLALERQLVFVHPYDDPAVMAGQGTLALEMLEDAPDLDALVIPVGGGGLLAGCLVAATTLRPGIAVFGVEVEAYAAMAQKLAGRTVTVGGPTIAEGIAVRDIGEMPFELVRRRVTDILVVPERAVEEAIGLLAEGGKTVAEGAGAVGVAALLAFPVPLPRQARRRGDHRRQHRRAHPVQRAAAQPAARRAAAAAASANPRPARRAGRHRRQDRQQRRQYHRGVAPAPVRRRFRAGGGTGGDGRGPRSRARGGDRRSAGAELRGAAGVRK